VRLSKASLLLVILAAGALAQDFPGLHFEPPAGFSGAPSGDPAIYATPAQDAELHIYPFRRFHGTDAAAEFRDSLFREHLPRQYREEKRAAQPKVERISVQGAEAAYLARLDGRLRILIVVPGHVALLEFHAQAPAFERHWPAVEAMVKSMKVTEAGR
jgi:hypothetical protein